MRKIIKYFIYSISILAVILLFFIYYIYSINCNYINHDGKKIIDSKTIFGIEINYYNGLNMIEKACYNDAIKNFSYIIINGHKYTIRYCEALYYRGLCYYLINDTSSAFNDFLVFNNIYYTCSVCFDSKIQINYDYFYKMFIDSHIMSIIAYFQNNRKFNYNSYYSEMIGYSIILNTIKNKNQDWLIKVLNLFIDYLNNPTINKSVISNMTMLNSDEAYYYGVYYMLNENYTEALKYFIRVKPNSYKYQVAIVEISKCNKLIEKVTHFPDSLASP